MPIESFRAPINVGGGFIEGENARVSQQSPRQAQQLPLPGAEVPSCFAHVRPKAAEGGYRRRKLHGAQRRPDRCV